MTSSVRSNPLDLRGRRIFVTGGTGFVGRCLLDYLRDSVDCHGLGTRVTVLSRSPERFLQAFPIYSGLPWLDFVAGDLKNLPRINANAYTDLIHGAADTHSKADVMTWLDQLVDGTRLVLALARDIGVQRLLFISSGAVYGPQPHDVATLREDHSFAPSTMDVRAVYGHGKRMAEHLCAQYATSGGPECVIARCFAIVSPHIPLDGPYAMGNFLRDALAGQRIQITGSGRTIRSYIDGRDMAHWMMTLLRWGRSGEAYNVGSDQPFSMLELATTIREIVGNDQPIEVYDPDERTGFSVYLPEIAKAGNLGLRIDTPLREALTQTVRALQAAARRDRLKSFTTL
jgi:nucleoside-diphosphate-sugar epimerase